jgi:hypothetical protein
MTTRHVGAALGRERPPLGLRRFAVLERVGDRRASKIFALPAHERHARGFSSRQEVGFSAFSWNFSLRSIEGIGGCGTDVVVRG